MCCAEMEGSLSETLRIRGHFEQKQRTRTRGGIEPEPPSHPLNELAADVQPEAGSNDSALHLHVRSVELLEDPLPFLLGDPGPFVRDAEDDGLPGALDGHPDRTTRCVLERVVDQVLKHLARPRRIADGVGRFRLLELNPRRRVPHPLLLRDVLRQRNRIEALAHERQPVGLEPARDEHVLDDPDQVLRLLAHRGEELRTPLAGLYGAAATLLQRDGRAVEACERRPQLVGNRREEVALQLLETLLVRDVAERVDDSLFDLYAGHREPELARTELDGQRLRADVLLFTDRDVELGETRDRCERPAPDLPAR